MQRAIEGFYLDHLGTAQSVHPREEWSGLDGPAHRGTLATFEHTVDRGCALS